MRAFRSFRLLTVSLLTLLLASCGSFEKVKKSTDVNLKLTKANEYYDKKQFTKANELYQSLMPILRGTKNYEGLFLRYSYTFYNMKDYPNASLWFKNFTEIFPNSRDAEECEFMHALCLVKMAPKSNLDQTNTLKAMEAMQSFINMHPSSKHLVEANQHIFESRGKLEEKSKDAARLYFNIGQYKAAAIAYQDVINQFPESPGGDFYQYMVVRSYYEYARISITEKQAERYVNAIEAYNQLKDLYPQSKFVKDGLRYQEMADNNLKRINKS